MRGHRITLREIGRAAVEALALAAAFAAVALWALA